MNFQERLLQTIKNQNSLLCVGLDTLVEKIPLSVRSLSNPMFTFNKMIIDATVDVAAAYKVNTAFYEAWGVDGWRALKSTFDYMPSHIIKIADAKRGDIGNTSALYAKAFFDELGADAITVNPLLGLDAVQPFIQNPEKGVFFLCLTSNPGSQDFQYFSDGHTSLYQRRAHKVNEWNIRRNCGLVVGATHPEQLSDIRRTTDVPFLIPGIGAQGGDLEQAVQYGTDDNNTNALFNSSRAIIFASSQDDFAQAARLHSLKIRDDINNIRIQKTIIGSKS